jgi:hypothetical protein
METILAICMVIDLSLYSFAKTPSKFQVISQPALPFVLSCFLKKEAIKSTLPYLGIIFGYCQELKV